MTVPEEHHWLFWDIDPQSLETERDQRYVISRVLERGKLSDVRWLAAEYGLPAIREFFESGAEPEISPPTWSLWRACFGETEETWKSPHSWKKNSDAPSIDSSR